MTTPGMMPELAAAASLMAAIDADNHERAEWDEQRAKAMDLLEIRPPSKSSWLGYVVPMALGVMAGGLSVLAKYPTIAVFAVAGFVTFIGLVVVDKINHRG